MSPQIIVLKSSQNIKPYISYLKKSAERSLKKVLNVLKVENVDIVLFENPEATIKHLGVGGFSPNKNTVFIYLDPKHRKFKKDLEVNLLGTMAHELHHSKRWGGIGYGKTLLDAMISEGLADHFEIEVRGGKPGRWDKALDSRNLSKYMNLAKSEFYNTDYNHYEWFFGKGNRNIPQWTGYTLGFHLVKEYLSKHPTDKASNLFGAKSKLFVSNLD